MKPTILTFSSWYLPGYKAGGPIRTVTNTVRHLERFFRFRVVTRDRDLGDGAPYAGIVTKTWIKTDGAIVIYLGPRERSLRTIRAVIREVHPEILYLNSIFDRAFTIRPLFLRRIGLVEKNLPVVIAPRGELSPAALAIKPMRKRIFLAVAKAIGLYGGAVWQAASPSEAEDIRRVFGSGVHLAIAPDLPPIAGSHEPNPKNRSKEKGRLRAAFLSRISPIKNLDGALTILAGVNGAVEYDIYGPIEDSSYWEACREVAERLPSNITVRYRGQVENSGVIELLSQYDVLFLPTRGESFGHVILEALIAGCPVLISDRTPWKALEEKRAGWDINLHDRERFASVLQTLVSMDGADHLQWREGARKLAKTFCHDPERISATYALFVQCASHEQRK